MFNKQGINSNKLKQINNEKGKNMRKIFYLLIIILLPIISYADIIKYVGFGTTRAALRSEDGKSEWGRYLGLGLEYSKPSSILFAVEVNYATKKVTLENKTWPSGSDPVNSGISIGDVPVNGSFYELTMKIGYHKPIINNQTAIKLFTGATISLQNRYLSKFRAKIRLDYDEENGPYQFDYLRCEDEGTIPNLSLDGIIGIIISYKNCGVEGRYTNSFTERKCIRGLAINGKLDTCYILFRYSF